MKNNLFEEVNGVLISRMLKEGCKVSEIKTDFNEQVSFVTEGIMILICLERRCIVEISVMSMCTYREVGLSDLSALQRKRLEIAKRRMGL